MEIDTLPCAICTTLVGPLRLLNGKLAASVYLVNLLLEPVLLKVRSGRKGMLERKQTRMGRTERHYNPTRTSGSKDGPRRRVWVDIEGSDGAMKRARDGEWAEQSQVD